MISFFRLKNLLCLCLLSCSVNSIAAPIGTILFTLNKVTVLHNAQSIPLTRGSFIYVGDTIVTSSNGEAQLKYNNGTLINIQPNSNYKTIDYSSNPTKQSLNAYLSKGSIHYKSDGQKRATIGNPVAALAISGTEFTLTLPPKGGVYVEVFSGKVIVNHQLVTPGVPHQYMKQGGTIIESTPNNANTTTSNQKVSVQKTPDGHTKFLSNKGHVLFTMNKQGEIRDQRNGKIIATIRSNNISRLVVHISTDWNSRTDQHQIHKERFIIIGSASAASTTPNANNSNITQSAAATPGICCQQSMVFAALICTSCAP